MTTGPLGAFGVIYLPDFLSFRVRTGIVFCHRGQKQINPAWSCGPWSLFLQRSTISPDLINDTWMWLSKCESNTRFLSSCSAALPRLAIKLKLRRGLSCLVFKGLLRRVSTKSCDVTDLFACVSFGSAEPFEDHCVAVSATAELGISGDFLCNFVIVLWCDLDRSL